MKTTFLAALLALCALPARAAKAEKLVARLHQTNQQEIALGRLAQRKGGSDEIKNYGLLLERDHRLGDKQVLDVAADENITVETLPASAEDAAMKAKLEKLSGKAFDEAFLKAMEAGHRKTIALLAPLQDRTGDVRLDRVVGKLLPILRQHQEISEHLQNNA